MAIIKSKPQRKCIWRGPIVPTWTINNPFRAAKADLNGNHIISKIETTSKVSLKLTSRRNLGRRETCMHQALHLPTPPHPTAGNAPSPGQKGHIVPKGTINNPPRTAKAATNGNHRPPKTETTSKVPLKLTRRINPGRWGACAKPSTLDTALKRSPSPPQQPGKG